MHNTPLDERLRERLLLSRAVPGDRLMLADTTLLAALDGSRPLTANERAALQQSPLTVRRFRQLALARRSASTGVADSDAVGTVPVAPGLRAGNAAANDAHWHGSPGMLRAAASDDGLDILSTDDGYWTLHFLPEGGGWQVVLKLAGEAPFAARLLREQTMLRVVDGGGAIVLQGRLDADGECEKTWPFATAPAPHFHLYGARFAVEPVAP